VNQCALPDPRICSREELFRCVVEGFDDAHFVARVVNDDLIIDYANARAAEFAGSSRDAVIGKRTSELDPRAVTGEVFQVATRVVASGVPAYGECVTSSGVWLDYRVVPIANGVVVSLRDCSDSHVLRAAMKQLKEAVLIIAVQELRVLFANDAFSALTGASPTVGMTVEALLGEMGVPEASSALVIEQLRSPPGSGVIELASRTITWRSSCVREPGGEVSSCLLLLQDVTEERRREAERGRLEASGRKSVLEWWRTFDAIESPILLLDVHGRVKRLNRAAQELSGRRYSANLEQHVQTLGAGEPWASAAALVAEVITSRMSAAAQVRQRATESTWDLSVSYVSEVGTAHEEEARVLVVVRDVTRTTELQESL